MIALSVNQPFAEQILRAEKKFEYRSIATRIRGRVFIYATLRERLDEFQKMGVLPGSFPKGVLVGTVEIADCKGEAGDYRWVLTRPVRAKRLLKPKGKPQPVWFYPF